LISIEMEKELALLLPSNWTVTHKHPTATLIYQLIKVE
jgi:hypothetical protein